MSHEIAAEADIAKTVATIKKNNINNTKSTELSMLHQQHRIKSLVVLEKEFKTVLKSDAVQRTYAPIPKSVTHNHDTDDDELT